MLDKNIAGTEANRFSCSIPNIEEPRQIRVITIRMSPELHTRLIDAGHKAKRSMNALYIEMIEHCLKDLEKQE